MKIGLVVKATLKNHNLMATRLDLGHYKISSFVEYLNSNGTNISYAYYRSIESMQSNPSSSLISSLCDTLKKEPEFLFPEASRYVVDKAKKMSKTRYLVQDAKNLLSNQGQQSIAQKDLALDIEALLSTLDPRERKVLEFRYYGDMTLREVGKKLKIGQERVRQIESKAIRKLRHPSKGTTELKNNH